MAAAAAVTRVHGDSLCAACGLPRDSMYFDESGVADLPAPGREVVLARFELSPQYCGILEYFSQFTDRLAVSPWEIETPGLDWMIRSNGRPLAPYAQFDRILNPWGYGSFQIGLRLDDNATIELAIRNRHYAAPPASAPIERVGGRVVGRYWFNSGCERATRRAF
jgi:hypothetical protein